MPRAYLENPGSSHFQCPLTFSSLAGPSPPSDSIACSAPARGIRMCLLHRLKWELLQGETAGCAVPRSFEPSSGLHTPNTLVHLTCRSGGGSQRPPRPHHLNDHLSLAPPPVEYFGLSLTIIRDRILHSSFAMRDGPADDFRSRRVSIGITPRADSPRQTASLEARKGLALRPVAGRGAGSA